MTFVLVLITLTTVITSMRLLMLGHPFLALLITIGGTALLVWSGKVIK